MKKSRLIVHKAIREWGYNLNVIEEAGKGYVRFYQYSDDATAAYICDLDVAEEERKKGLGNFILLACEKAAKDVGASKMRLWVKKGSWMQKWYERCGYSYFKDKEETENAVWMEKSLMPVPEIGED